MPSASCSGIDPMRLLQFASPYHFSQPSPAWCLIQLMTDLADISHCRWVAQQVRWSIRARVAERLSTVSGHFCNPLPYGVLCSSLLVGCTHARTPTVGIPEGPAYCVPQYLAAAPREYRRNSRRVSMFYFSRLSSCLRRMRVGVLE